MIEEAIASIMVNNSGVAAAVTGKDDQGNPRVQVFASKAPEWAVEPYVVYMQTSAKQPRHQTGASNLQKSLFQVTSLAPTYGVAKAVSRAVWNALNMYAGTVSGCVINRIARTESADTYEPPPDGTDDGIHQIHQEYLAWSTANN